MLTTTARILKIWVVDRPNADLQYSEILADGPWQIRVFTSLKPLLAETRAGRAPDLFILDSDTPDSAQFLETLGKLACCDAVPVFVIGTPFDAADTMPSVEFLAKPSSPHVLKQRVQSRMRTRALLLDLDRKRREADFLLGMSCTLNSRLDLQHILGQLVGGASSALEVERCSIFLFEDGRGEWPKCRLMVASDDRDMSDLLIDITRYPEILHILDTHEAVIIEDVAASPLLASVGSTLEAQGIRSMALFPMMVGAELVGVLFFRSAAPHWPITEERKALAQATAHIAATAIRNTRMYQTIADDLRARQDMERQLALVNEELERARRRAVTAELAGATAHELNQPLTSALGYVELLKMKLPADDPAHVPADRVHEQIKRMARIVKKLGNLDTYKTKPYVGETQIVDLSPTSDSADE